MIIYTVYDKPTDYPTEYVVRTFHIKDGKVIPDKELYMRNKDVYEIYYHMQKLGLVYMPRQKDDDEKIMGVYL